MDTPNKFLRLVNSGFKFRLFLLTKLPSAYFSGVRVRSLDQEKCVVTVPFKWFSQNPFRSTYFACLSMAAEMTTGLLSMAAVYGRKPAISMLVVKVDSQYFKKATGRTIFTCQDGFALSKLIEEAALTGEAKTFTATSTGVD
ncbi:MAG: DUF4442 domain-containing protein, partial [Chitinophagaceae bacterium]